MPILDIQTRFRELGRIRAGKKVPTSGGKSRPEKIPRFRLTSPWSHLIEQAADVFGGTAEPWDNDGKAEYEVFVAVDALPVVIPPGEVMDQWYELWSGGGCQRRCDGLRQVLVDKPCQCPADPIERQEAAGGLRPTACKPTTRLRLMIPDVADVGIWRLESHGFHAAAELGGAVGLIEAASRAGAMIPADLRLAAREGARRPGQPGKKFYVPAISFRGTLGPTLAALGILEEGSVMPRILGVEARPALDAGGPAALPPGGTAFDPAPVASASFGPPPPATGTGPAGPAVPTPPPAPPEPTGFAPPPPPTQPPPEAPLPDPEAFTPPPAPPADEEGGGPAYSGAQIIAMRFDDRGVKDRAYRLRLVSWLTGREITSGKDLTPPEIRVTLEVLNDDETFADLIAQNPPEDPPTVDETLPEAPPAPDVPPAAPEALKGELVDAPPSGRRRAAAPGPEAMNGEQWRAFLTDRKVKVTELIREASKLARESDIAAPANLDEIAASPLATMLIGFVEETAAARGGDR